MLDTLRKALEDAGKSAIVCENPEGSRVLVLPHGGRVLGLFGTRTAENFLWTNPALAEGGSAQAFFSNGAWQNSGGDRTWLSPEIDFFFPRFPDVSFYWQPRELDPGNYTMVNHGQSVVLVNRLSLTSSRSKETVGLQITKSVEAARNPLRWAKDFDDMREIEYAGYRLSTSLEFTSPNAESTLRVGLWNLLQMPPGGEMLVATYAACEPSVYLGQIDCSKLTVTEHLSRFPMCGPGVQKIGFRAACTTGRAGYLYPTGHQHALVVRNFFVDPSGEYIDAPKHEFMNTGDAVQACSVENALGRFSELEYHVPAMGKGTGRIRSHDVSQVWAFRGPLPQIQQIAKTLLSAAF